MHNLFKNVPKANKKGVKLILVCYKSGKSHLEAILRQNMRRTKFYVTFGHGAQDINHYTYAELKKSNKQERKKTKKIIIQEDITYSELFESEFLFPIQVSNVETYKAQACQKKTTKAKKEILGPLLEYKNYY
ncbi:23350_t:CDS:1 [Cetraspora pellucida]|uniref:23350_t:CDS:1 n=1 Tax=Cetraspora pellucida TaxID=1433469 RepID=A0A9N9BCN2_9GLOM|nr:23350_t:CDS:1 [Cetraspora pellucida]